MLKQNNYFYRYKDSRIKKITTVLCGISIFCCLSGTIYADDQSNKNDLVTITSNYSQINNLIGWIYQVGNPEALDVKAYRRNIEPLPEIEMVYPKAKPLDISQKDWDCLIKRFQAWQRVHDILKEKGWKKGHILASRRLEQYAIMLAENGYKDAAHKNFIYVDMLKSPEYIPKKYSEEIYNGVQCLWIAHLWYVPGDTVYDVLEEIDTANSKEVRLNKYDYIIALYNAYYVYKNALTSESRYVRSADKYLSQIFENINDTNAKEVAQYLQQKSEHSEVAANIIKILPKLPSFSQTNISFLNLLSNNKKTL